MATLTAKNIMNRTSLYVAKLSMLVFFANSSNAQLLDLQDVPLFVNETNVPPNIIVSFDDSGSMSWGFMPDSIQTVDDSSSEPEAKSARYNRIYYDREVTYLPPVNHLGVEYPTASFTAANPDFYDMGSYGISGSSLNLSTSFRVRWNAGNFFGWGPRFASEGGSTAGQPAYYYQYDSSRANCDVDDDTDDDCYYKVVVSATSGPGRARPELGGVTSTDERTNFANWFQYYSYRSIAGKTALSRAFGPEQIPESFRVARQTINRRGPKSGDPGTGVTGGDSRVAEFSIQQREYFYDWLWNVAASGGTPLREAMNEAGKHYSLSASSSNSPYRIVPGDSNSPELSCRVNTHILLTDGNWNGNPSGLPGADILDQNSYKFPETIGAVNQYVPDSSDTKIYYHGESRINLADYSFHYWAKDLRTDLANNVPTNYVEMTAADEPVYPEDFWNPVNDPATWQHMRNYTVAFGTAGRVPLTEDVYQSLLSGQPFTDNTQTPPDASVGWRSTGNTDYRTDDVYHAAINSRGSFFNAQNPNDLVEAFSSIASTLKALDSSVTTLTANSGAISSDTLLYQASFNTSSWTGELTAFNVSDGSGILDSSVTGCNALPLGTKCSEAWNAAERSDSSFIDHTTRNVFTYAPPVPQVFDGAPAGAGVNFSWNGGLNADQQSLLDAGDGLGSQRVDYLRGDDANEGSLFRQRPEVGGSGADSRLGPIVHSSPVYAGSGVDANGAREFSFPDNLESASYSVFLASISSRPEMVYVGANDGMLHAYNASNSASGGQEVFSYVPGPVIENLPDLTDPSFNSGAYVDGPIRLQDVFYSGAWETLLVGGLRTGGQGYYALEVTNPNAGASDIVRWEFTDDNDADMGYSYGAPVIARANNDRWVVIVANGYNSQKPDGRQGSGGATLFVLDAEDGSKLAEFNVGGGSANGLSAPVAASADGDLNIDYVYAGDLQGHLWKFDLTSDNPADWTQASQLFDGGTNRPITAAPTVGTHPGNLGGRVVYFGTGQYLEPGDVSTTSQQSFFAIWDQDNGSTITESDLLTQSVDSLTQVRQTSGNPMNWNSYKGWELELRSGSGGEAERVTGKARLLGGVVVFTSIVPSSNVCDGGGVESYLFALNRNDGGVYQDQVFDINNDGLIDIDDKVDEDTPVNIVRIDGYGGPPTYFGDDSGPKGLVCVGDECNIVDNFGTKGRVRWRQLQ